MITRKLVAPTKKAIKLDPIHANVGIEAAYRKKLQALIAEMSHSFIYWTRATWNKSPPAMAQDDVGFSRTKSIIDLRKAMERLGKHWQRRFDALAPELAKIFVDGATQHTNSSMMSSLKKAGFTVKFKMTPQVSEAYHAVLAENVGLIKSISAEYLHDVQGHVWQAVKSGYDLGTLTNTLQERYGVTHSRAALIARDQSNKAKAVIENVRRKELGISKAIWQHSSGGKIPRQSHVDANGKEFDLGKGMYIDGEWILPGEKINCRCTSRAVIPGFED